MIYALISYQTANKYWKSHLLEPQDLIRIPQILNLMLFYSILLTVDRSLLMVVHISLLTNFGYIYYVYLYYCIFFGPGGVVLHTSTICIVY